MNISSETLKQLDALYTYIFMDDYMNEVQADKATELHIGFARAIGDDDPEYIGKSIKATKKETTLEYITDKLSAISVYKSFASHFGKLIKPMGLNAYPTTYGIGIFVMLMRNKTSETIQNEIDTLLTNLGIEYKTEFSDAHWVFRYKISKSAKNIERLNQVVNQK
jgi:hypothetical protein